MVPAFAELARLAPAAAAVPLFARLLARFEVFGFGLFGRLAPRLDAFGFGALPRFAPRLDAPGLFASGRFAAIWLLGRCPYCSLRGTAFAMEAPGFCP